VDRPVECVRVSEGLMREMMRFEVMPDAFDVVQFGRIFGQPLDDEPVGAGGAKSAPSRRLWHALHDVDEYLRGQSSWLANYAKRYRAGLRVGTSITEGTANFLVNQRMNKSQQMR
jgi:hypothetical protein